MARVVILGGGVGGTTAANNLARRRGDIQITVVGSHGDHLFQPGFLRLPFDGERLPLERDERALLRPGVRLVVERVHRVDPDKRLVLFESGEGLYYDWLVIATGSRLDHLRLPGGREANHQFHCWRGARRLGEALAAFEGGTIVVGAVCLPYKCLPTPIEFTLLLDEWLRARAIRKRTRLVFVYPLEDVFPYESIARMVRPMLEERGVEIHTSFSEPLIDPRRRTVSSNDKTLSFDLLVLVPPHSCAPFLRQSGLVNAGGWVPTDPATLRVEDRIYALGDTANLQCPKSGSAARHQAGVVVENVMAEIEERGATAHYDGRAVCFMETGFRRASLVEFSYERPSATRPPTRLVYWQKLLFHRFYFSMVRRS